MVSLRRSGRHVSKGKNVLDQKSEDSQRSAAFERVEEPPESQDGVQFDTLSTATLPPRYTITAALSAGDLPLTPERHYADYVQGEEALSDAWRRDDAAGEGRLEVRWKNGQGVKRRKIGRGGNVCYTTTPTERRQKLHDLQNRFQDGSVPLWYTAGLTFPCLCELSHASSVFSPRFSPPRINDLHPLPEHLDLNEKPIHGLDLPDWCRPGPDPEMSLRDIEPGLDHLKEFEALWRDADGGWGRGWACDQIVASQHTRIAAAGPSGVDRDAAGVIVPISPRMHAGDGDRASRSRDTDRKGKMKAVESPKGDLFAIPPLPVRSDSIHHKHTPAIPGTQLDSSHSASIRTGREVERSHDDWQAESKRRKAVWRAMIQSDAGYGKMWSTVEWPHSYRAPPPRQLSTRFRSEKRYPDFILPRALSTSEHPYHPDLAHYITKHPHGRVYWLIPIHGPVWIPGINGSDLAGPPVILSAGSDSVVQHPLSPSRAALSDIRPHVDSATRPYPLLWTTSSLTYFMKKCVLPLYKGERQPFGSLSIKLSGPKPDPFLDLIEPVPLTKHAFSPPRPGQSVQIQARAASRPVRPECGDHIRLYVDAQHALALRSWLYTVSIPDEPAERRYGTASAAAAEPFRLDGDPPSTSSVKAALRISDGDPVISERAQVGLRIFKKTRLALVGEKAEVLVVA